MMHSDPKLFKRIESLASKYSLEQRTMFGGAAWFRHGHMVTGIWHDKLVLRLGVPASEAAMDRDHVVPMDITGRPMRGWVMVEPAGLQNPAELNAWVSKAHDFNHTLTPKS